WHVCGGSLHGPQFAACGRARHSDEHPRLDGTDRTEYRAGTESHLAGTIRHDGHYGADDDDGDNAHTSRFDESDGPSGRSYRVSLRAAVSVARGYSSIFAHETPGAGQIQQVEAGDGR